MHLLVVVALGIYLLYFLYIMAAIGWLGMFINTVPWRDFCMLKHKKLPAFMSFMYLMQAVALLFYVINLSNPALRGFPILCIEYWNWITCLLILVTAVVAIEAGYGKLGHVTLLLAGAQAIAYAAIPALLASLASMDGIVAGVAEHWELLQIVLLFASGIVWLVFFMEITPWRNLGALHGNWMLKFLVMMYMSHFLVFVLYGFSILFAWMADEAISTTHPIMFINWFVWLANAVASLVAVFNGYRKFGIAGLVACFCQLFVYLIAFVPVCKI